ncbi:hypothetical protein FRC03_011945 [Tulasnella sp. 419]|nr:hypothetical protein FRC03_011945 [Tulasnella sp. 419]
MAMDTELKDIDIINLQMLNSISFHETRYHPIIVAEKQQHYSRPAESCVVNHSRTKADYDILREMLHLVVLWMDIILVRVEVWQLLLLLRPELV